MILPKRLAMALILAAPVFALAQDEPPPPERLQEVPQAGFWPTQRMMDRIVVKITEEMGEQYEMDEDQLERTRALVERFPKWFQDNRAEIMDLTNQYFEALLEDDPPTPEVVAAWAARVLPLTQEFKGLVDETTDEMRTFMTDDQQDKLEQELAGVNVGFNFVTNKLGAWAAGGYDPETEWINDRGRERDIEEKRAVKAEADAAAAAEKAAQEGERAEIADAQGGGTPPPATADIAKPTETSKAKPKDEWETYVDDFIRRYELDEAQKNSAYRILRAQQQERERLLTRRAKDIDRAQKLVADAKTPDEKAAAKAEYEKVNAPIERCYQKLKDGLDKLPTRKQKADAAKKENDKPAKEADKPAKSEEKESAAAGGATPK